MTIYKIRAYIPADYDKALQIVLSWMQEHFAGLYDYTADNQELAVISDRMLHGQLIYSDDRTCIGFIEFIDSEL